MLKLSLCIEMFWPDAPFPERVRRAAKLGYRTYEFWSWWDKDIEDIARAADESGLDAGAMCVRTAFAGGAPPLLLPDGREPFVNAVRECLPAAKRLRCPNLIVTTGNTLPDVPRDVQRAACVEALKAAAPVAAEAGLTLVLEPLNPVDHAGYYLALSPEGFAIAREVDSPAVRLLFDIYHQQVSEGHVTASIREGIGLIGHFHVANSPGRYEPFLGELDYDFIFDEIRDTGYDRYVGLEFRPSEPRHTDGILSRTLAMA